MRGIVHSVVVDKHGGSMSLAPAPGEGSTFIIGLHVLGADANA